MVRVGVKPHQLGAGIDELRRAWREAEDAGFESIWVFDHVYHVEAQTSLEALSLLSAMAEATSSVRIGVLVLNASLRHPGMVASAAATIDQLSGGRLELGLGAGSGFGALDLAMQFGATPSLRARMDRLEEACEVITRLWAGETLDFEGPTVRLSKARLGVERVQPNAPIIVGGGGRRSQRIAAKWAREWNVSRPSVDEFRGRSRAFAAMAGPDVGRSVQVPLRDYPGKSPRWVVDEFAAAGADRVVLMLDPPYEAGAVTNLGREIFD